MVSLKVVKKIKKISIFLIETKTLKMGLRRGKVTQVELIRDGLQAQWGFRLKGGSDVDGGTPLEVMKVRRLKEFVYGYCKC